MAAKSFAKCFGRFYTERNILFFSNTFNQKVVGLSKCTYSAHLVPTRCCHTNVSSNQVSVHYSNGLPVISVHLPSRDELCQFTLKPVTNTLNDLIHNIQQEDRGVDRVAVYSTDGVRIAGATSIDILMRDDFELIINDHKYNVTPPKDVYPSSSEHTMETISELKTSINKLYSALNVDQHQLESEAKLQQRLEELKMEMEPYQKKHTEIAKQADLHTHRLKWLGLGLMGLQFGILARLTWWEYSWDIMEPVTYFVTYGTSMAMMAYYVATKQEYTFPAVRDRQFLIKLHKLANKNELDVTKYNELSDAIAQTEYDLQRLRDPLQMQLPVTPIPAKRKNEQNA